MRSIHNLLAFLPLAVIMFLPLCTPASSAGTGVGAGTAPAVQPRFTDPAAIDRAVSAFTGAAIGEVGGARTHADRRLRLAACPSPLAASWHGSGRSTVRVECAEPGGWRIFIATRPAQQAAAAQRVVERGDPMTVMVRGRGFSVQQSGEATESGAIGDWIAIRTARNGDPIRARIERPGLAIIPAN